MSRRKPNGQFEKGTHWRSEKPFWSKGWCVREYVEKGRSGVDIARQFGVGGTAIHFWLKKHGIKMRTTKEARRLKHWGASGVDNPMWNKRGELNPRWMGGVTPERQGFYTSDAWKRACSAVWKRDLARCRRCTLHRDDRPDMPFHIHHIIPFSVAERRADVQNLVLLCEACHQFVHSRRNRAREYLPDSGDTTAPS